MEYERSVKEWIRILKGSPHYPHTRQRAAEALGKLGDRSAVKPLTKVLRNDLDGVVRKAAAGALGELGDPRALKSLIDALLLEERIDVRVLAAWALGRIGDQTAVNPLITALRTTASDKPSTTIEKPRTERERQRPKTRYVLVETRTRYSRTRELVKRREPITQHELSIQRGPKVERLAYVRRSAALALGRLGDQRAIEPLIHAMRNDLSVEVQQSAALALREFLPELDVQTRSEIEALIPEPAPLEEETTETHLEPAPVTRTRKAKLRCPSCQRIIRKKENLCSKCGKVLSRCLVCHNVIGPSDDYTQCPHCKGLAHRGHLEQWLLIKAICPYCQEPIQPHSLS